MKPMNYKQNCFLKSFQCAVSGLLYAFKHERNVKIHFCFMLLVIILGLSFHISAFKWCIIVLTCSIVIGFELINTSIELLSDLITTSHNSTIKKIKDIASASVLASSISAIIIGLIIFGPEMFNILKNWVL